MTLHLRQHLAYSTLRAQPDSPCFFLGVGVLRHSRVFLDGACPVANILDLIDRMTCGDRAAHLVITNKRLAHASTFAAVWAATVSCMSFGRTFPLVSAAILAMTSWRGTRSPLTYRWTAWTVTPIASAKAGRLIFRWERYSRNC